MDPGNAPSAADAGQAKQAETVRKYQIILELIPKLVCEIDENGVIRYANGELQAFGYERDEVAGRDILDFIHPADRAQADRKKDKDIPPEEYLKRGIKKAYALNTRRSDTKRLTRGLPLRFQTKDGHYRTLRFDASGIVVDGGQGPLYDVLPAPYRSLKVESFAVRDQGRYLGTFVFGDDVTEQRRLEQELQESREQLRIQNILLEKKNESLREDLAGLEQEKGQIQTGLAEQLQRLILPVIERFEARASGAEREQLGLLRKSVEAVAEPLLTRGRLERMGLTQRELEICRLVRDNFSSREISHLLGISTVTVERHRNNIRAKLNLAGNRQDLAEHLRSM